MKHPRPADSADGPGERELEEHVTRVLSKWRAQAESEYPQSRMAALEARLVEAAARRVRPPEVTPGGVFPRMFRWMGEALAGGHQVSRRLAVGTGLAVSLLVGVMTLQVARDTSPYALDPALRSERLLAATEFKARSASVESVHYQIRTATPGRTSLAIAARLTELGIPFTLKTSTSGAGSLRFIAPSKIPAPLQGLFHSLDIGPVAQQPVLLTITAP